MELFVALMTANVPVWFALIPVVIAFVLLGMLFTWCLVSVGQITSIIVLEQKTTENEEYNVLTPHGKIGEIQRDKVSKELLFYDNGGGLWTECSLAELSTRLSHLNNK